MEEPQRAPRNLQYDRVAVIVPAAGSGSRMGGAPKQFRTLGDAPVLVHTLRAFAQLDEIRTLIVAVLESDVGEVERLVAEYHLDANVVVGGATRQDSVRESIKAVGGSAGIILVHDAVRPFIRGGQIREVIAAIDEHGAAAMAVPVTDTLRRGSVGVFGESVDREGLFRMLTPQGALTDLFLKAHEKAQADGFVGTDEVEVLHRAGVEVHLVLGDERNIKLTRPSEWALAETLWLDWLKEKALRPEEKTEGCGRMPT